MGRFFSGNQPLNLNLWDVWQIKNVDAYSEENQCGKAAMQHITCQVYQRAGI